MLLVKFFHFHPPYLFIALLLFRHFYFLECIPFAYDSFNDLIHAVLVLLVLILFLFPL